MLIFTTYVYAAIRGVRANVKVVRLKDGYKTRGSGGMPPGKIFTFMF